MSKSVWTCEVEAVIAWQTFESVWSCEDERLCDCLADEWVCVIL